jgi:hypothetical protein
VKSLCCLLLALSGCQMVPNTVSPELIHQSHIMQHRPLTDEPTNYHADQFAVAARWAKRTGPFLELSEGISLDKAYNQGGINPSYGAMIGPKEEFTARVGWTFRTRE